MSKARIKRDVVPDKDRVWHILKHGPLSLQLTIQKRACSDGPPDNRHYLEYIVTNKRPEDINWDTEDWVREPDSEEEESKKLDVEKQSKPLSGFKKLINKLKNLV